MLFHYFISALGLLASNVIALQLAPISNPTQWTGPTSSKRELASFTGDLDLQDFESFFWGAPAGNKLIYANLTVYFPEQYRSIISMERFAGSLKSVNCAEDMMLEFTDDATFEYAKSVWNWVNSAVNHTFIMVTNYEGCADDMERLPFEVSNIRYDEEANKAFLTADAKTWEEVAHSYTLNVGHEELTPTHRMMMARDVMPRGSDFSISLASNYNKNLFSTTVGGWTTSVDAVIGTTGSIDIDFSVDVSWLKLKSASMTAQPKDVTASVQIALSESGTLANAYNWKKTVVSIPIEGIEIAAIAKIGAFLDVDVGFTMNEWSGTAVANFGARAALSNAAMVKVDLINSKNNKFSGWTPSFTPIAPTLSANIKGSAKVYAEPNVKLEASVFGKGWNVGLDLQLPYIQANFTAMADSNGVCDSKKTLGVDIAAKVGVDLHAQAAKKGDEANPFWSQQLFNQEWPLFDKCLAFGGDNAHPSGVADPNPSASKTDSSVPTEATTTASTEKPESTNSATASSNPSDIASKTEIATSIDKPTGSSIIDPSSSSKIDMDKPSATGSDAPSKTSVPVSAATSSHATGSSATSPNATGSAATGSIAPGSTATSSHATESMTTGSIATGIATTSSHANSTEAATVPTISQKASSSSGVSKPSSTSLGNGNGNGNEPDLVKTAKATTSSQGSLTASPEPSSSSKPSGSASTSCTTSTKVPSASYSSASVSLIVRPSSSSQPVYSATTKISSPSSSTSCTSSIEVASSGSHPTYSTNAPPSSLHSIYSTVKPSSSTHPADSVAAPSSLITVYQAPSVTSKKP